MSSEACPGCGVAVPQDASPRGLCPRCLLGLGLEGRDRFIPGQRLLDRYRIVALLGRGGMGEVYRADDLQLGEPVALKFLSPTLADEPTVRTRLLNEARTARRITHPNVCRVHDIGELRGQVFLSMEYVDGEDLATLLRRIRRLPRDTAAVIAQQVCSGLAAAHECGVLHRDIKPANIMIDGQGRIRIADFGLATLAAEQREAGTSAGTPAYMAPEQHAGGEATVRSDIYSLGLVLYEIFTGVGPAALGLDRDRPRVPAAPSTHVGGLDPALDEAVLGCLDPRPERRPASVAAVAASLPGGDPLAASVAAGATPEPEMVAQAGSRGPLGRRVAWAGLAAVIAGLAAIVGLSSRTQLTRISPLPRPPEVLVERARQIVFELGYRDAPVDEAHAFSYDVAVLEHLEQRDDTARRWEPLGDATHAPIRFWYRRSPRPLVPGDPAGPRIGYDDPPRNVPGMLGVRMDPRGLLLRFDAVPSGSAAVSGEPSPLPRDRLFALAGLDPDRFRAVPPASLPDVFADERKAWLGSRAEAPDVPMRVEAATLAGAIVAFRVMPPWTDGRDAPPPPISRVRSLGGGALGRASHLAYSVLLIGGVIGAAVLARRNLRARRGHLKGALRLAGYMFALAMAIWALRAHHVAAAAELPMAVRAAATALSWSVLTWLLYIALEPPLRRIWPRTVISWIRLLEGRTRDPLVGQHVLAGCVIGVGLALLLQLYQVAPAWLGMTPPRPDLINAPANELEGLGGLRHSLGVLLAVHWNQLFYGLLYACALLLLRLLTRHDGAAIAGILVIGALIVNTGAGNPWLDLALATVLTGACVVAFFRFGVLTVVVALTLAYLSGGLTLTFDLSSWYAPGSILVLASYLLPAVYGFRVALAGKRSVKGGWLPE